VRIKEIYIIKENKGKFLKGVIRIKGKRIKNKAFL